MEEAACMGGSLHALPEGSNDAVAPTSVPHHEGCSFHLPLLSPVAWVATLTSGLKCQESTMRLVAQMSFRCISAQERGPRAVTHARSQKAAFKERPTVGLRFAPPAAESEAQLQHRGSQDAAPRLQRPWVPSSGRTT